MKSLYIMILISLCLVVISCKTINNRPYHERPSVEEYLSYQSELQKLSDRELNQEHDKIATRHASQPGPETRLYLALILAQSDHEESNLQSAKSHLREILDSEDSLPDNIAAFTRLKLMHINSLLRQQKLVNNQQEKITNLKKELSKSREQLDNSDSKIKELQHRLEEANDKIRALTNIEKDLTGSTQTSP